MKDLIEALTIFLKYGDPHKSTCCMHDSLLVICTKEVSKEDEVRLDELGFFWSDKHGYWESFRYGSA